MTVHTHLPAKSNGDSITAAEWNTYGRDNFLISPAALVTQNGDFYASSGSGQASVVLAGTSGQIIETDSSQETGLKNSWGFIPVGGIIMWAGSLGSLPSNWQLCDGSNGTPNLSSKFVIGAGGSYAVGATGGSTTANLAHAHNTFTSTTSGSHKHTQPNTNAGSAHRHSVTSNSASGATLTSSWGISNTMAGNSHKHTVYSGYDSSHTHAKPDTGSASGHSHTLSLSSALSSSQSIMPPYYTLAYIRRMS